MTTRRLLLGSAAMCASGLISPFAMASASSPVSGKDFTVVTPPMGFADSPILIHNFFAYTCPHCLSFEPNFEAFVSEVAGDKNIRIVDVPVAWTPNYETFPRAYFSFVALGLKDKLHLPFWEWVLKEEHDWADTDALNRDVTGWVVRNGVKEAEWNGVMRSFSVSSQTRQATQMWRQYGIDSTPAVGIAGKFITAPHLVGTRGGTIDVLNYLIAQVRKG